MPCRADIFCMCCAVLRGTAVDRMRPLFGWTLSTRTARGWLSSMMLSQDIHMCHIKGRRWAAVLLLKLFTVRVSGHAESRRACAAVPSTMAWASLAACLHVQTMLTCYYKQRDLLSCCLVVFSFLLCACFWGSQTISFHSVFASDPGSTITLISWKCELWEHACNSIVKQDFPLHSATNIGNAFSHWQISNMLHGS